MVGLIPRGSKDYELPMQAAPFEGIHISATELKEFGFKKGDKLRLVFQEII